MPQNRNRYGGDRSDWHVAISIFVVATIILSLAVSGFLDPLVSTLIMAGVFGAMVGWATGIVATPYQKDEKARLGGIANVAAGIMAGYLAAKLDRVFELYFSGTSATEAGNALTHLASFAIMGLASFVLTYITRSYDYENRTRQDGRPDGM